MITAPPASTDLREGLMRIVRAAGQIFMAMYATDLTVCRRDGAAPVTDDEVASSGVPSTPCPVHADTQPQVQRSAT